MIPTIPKRHVDDNQRLANDRHAHWVPLLVLAFLCALAYVWTDWMTDYPVPGLSSISEHPLFEKAFSDAHLSNQLWMHRDSSLSSQTQLRVLLLLAGICFLLAYYLPLHHKRWPVAIVTCVGVAFVLGTSALGFFLAWHMLAYVCFHTPDPRSKRALMVLGALSASLWLPWLDDQWKDLANYTLLAGLSLPILVLFYKRPGYAWLTGPAKPWVQGCMAHACLIYIALAVAWNAQQGNPTAIQPVGWLLFFWQWERVVMYHADLRDGRIPKDIGPMEYLATFISPAAFSNFHWLSRIPLGYAYLANAFMARDKNRIALSGLWLLLLAVFFFAMRPVLLEWLQQLMIWLGLEPFRYYGQMVRALHAGERLSPASVWCALILAFLSFYWLWTAVAHMKVGLWRLFGYDVEPYFQNPFLATNFIELWKRYSYYYREFLVRAFYYPVFLRFFRRQPRVRIMVASMAAAGFGNLLYHIVYATLYQGATLRALNEQLATTPYYLLLGAAIGLTQIYLLARGRRRRRPWQRGARLGLDVLAVIGTFGMFIWIRPLHHVPIHDSVLDAANIMLAALGIGPIR